MYVSLRVKDFAEAARAMGRIVEERADKENDVDKESIVDLGVLEGLVDAVVSFRPTDDASQSSSEASASHSNLVNRLSDLFTQQLLPHISISSHIYRYYGDFETYQRHYAAALDAYVAAYRRSVPNDPRVDNQLDRWKEAVEEVKDIVTKYKELGPRADEEKPESEGKGRWKFQAKSLLRSFMSRTRASFEDEPEWDELTELTERLKD